MRSLLITTICAFAIGFGTGSGQQSPTVEQILDRYVQALGGKAAIEKLSSRLTIQTTTRPEGEAATEVYEKAPNKRLTIMTFPNSTKMIVGYDGNVGWVKNPNADPQPVGDAELKMLRIRSDFYADLNLRRTFPKMVLKETTSIDGHPAYLIEASTADRVPERLFFDSATGLLVRRIQQAVAIIKQSDDDLPETKTIEVQLDFSDFRTVDGVKIPFRVRRHMPVFDSTTKVKEVRHNIEIDDAKFSMPAR